MPRLEFLATFAEAKSDPLFTILCGWYWLSTLENLHWHLLSTVICVSLKVLEREEAWGKKNCFWHKWMKDLIIAKQKSCSDERWNWLTREKELMTSTKHRTVDSGDHSLKGIFWCVQVIAFWGTEEDFTTSDCFFKGSLGCVLWKSFEDKIWEQFEDTCEGNGKR